MTLEERVARLEAILGGQIRDYEKRLKDDAIAAARFASPALLPLSDAEKAANERRNLGIA